MRELELTLQSENPQFRRIWVQYSHKGSYRIVITLFPQGTGDYEMTFGECPILTYDTVNTILQNYLVNRK